MINLQNKKILLVAPKAFGYEVSIYEKLKELGAIVDYFDERPSNSTFVKAFIRLNRRVINKIIYKHYDKIIRENQIKKYDYIFFIHLETPFSDILEKLKSVNEKGKYFLYMWDSMLHRPNTLELTKFFDKVFTFDRIDSLKYNFIFRPLFFLDDYALNNNKDIKHDISFIGTIHSDRYKIIKQIKIQCHNFGLRSYFFMFIHNKLMFYRMKFSNINNIDAQINDFSFTSLKRNDVIKTLQESKVILDIQHPENNGLTMRTLEALGLGRKLLTTNTDIYNYDFYNPNNICVIDRFNPVFDEAFIKLEYQDINKDVYNKYTINQWLRDIFC